MYIDKKGCDGFVKKTNWKKLQEKPKQDTAKFRDVYEDQQFDRSKIEDKQTMLPRTILTIICTIFVGVVTYFVVSGVYGVYHQFSTWNQSIQSQDTSMPSGDGSSEVDDIDMSHATDGYTLIPNPVIGDLYQRPGDAGLYTLEEVQEMYRQEQLAQRDTTTVGTEQSTGITSSGGINMRELLRPNMPKVLITLLVMVVFFGIMEQMMIRNLAAQNLMNDTSDINQYQNDQHIQLPEELQRNYDFFPDVGAHSGVVVSSMLSHMMVANKGIKMVDMPERAPTDIVSEDGDIEFYKGEVMVDDDDNVTYRKVPMFDKKFGEALFEASGMLPDKKLRKYYDPTQIPYNKGNKNRDRLKNYDTLADLINKEWELPDYEPQRPAGVYIVDSAPVNTIKICYVINA